MRMSIIILTVILAFVMLFSACSKADTAEPDDGYYYVRKAPSSENLDQKPSYEKFEDYDSAKNYCEEYAVYGSIICNSKKQCIYTPYTEVGSEILYQAKTVCDFIRDDHFTYGNAPINPAFDFSAHLVSCDRLVDWVLYRVGFTDQPYQNGKCVSGPWLTNWCIDQGFKKISKISDLEPGDIIFIRANKNGDPEHTFIYAGGGSGSYYRYDAGSDTRIQSTQPSYEPIDLFMYAYRAPGMPSDKGITYATEIPEAPTFKPGAYKEVFADNFDGDLKWKSLNDISTFKITNGALSVKSTGGDPYFEYDGVLDISCSEANTIRIRIKNSSYSTYFQVFFKTDTCPHYCGEASVGTDLRFFHVTDFNSVGFEEIELDMSSCPEWKGTLTGLRIDPICSTGKVLIDSVSVGWR